MADNLASLLSEDRLLNFLVLSSQALCCYDYCLTFAGEVEYVWSRKFSLPAALFYAFRYPAVLNTLFIALGYFPWRSWQTPHVSFSNLMKLFAFTLVLGLIAPVITMYSFILSSPILYEIVPEYAICYIDTAYVINLTSTAEVQQLTYCNAVIPQLDDGCPRILDSIRWLRPRLDLEGHASLDSARRIAKGPHERHSQKRIRKISDVQPRYTLVLLSRLMLDLRAAITGLLPFSSTSRSSTSRSTTSSGFTRTLGSLVFTGSRPPVAIELTTQGTSTSGPSEQDCVEVEPRTEDDGWNVMEGGDEGDVVLELRDMRRPRAGLGTDLSVEP
ncbi:hypothetical protein DAEQUDRAFT_737672 [Daedalea quercina L-15889]|uniref:DUF6533 domain-containing protein n=1 Tax=Daedalea quercina L-15889 TaxID=1314783 RepID=A0A165QTC7_9APHY|nr:hypothetical protein DAEQUDRAFT_737672 [Daedalea quercina L-15889]